MAIDGKWNTTIKTPMGDQTGVLTLKQEGDALTGQMESSTGTVAVEEGRVDGDRLLWVANVTSPMPVKLEFDAQLEGDDIGGKVKLGMFGESTFTGVKA